MTPSTIVDASTVRAAALGDPEARELFAGAAWKVAAAVALRQGAQNADAEDVAAAVTLRALRGLQGMRAPGAWRSWVGRGAVREVASLRRSSRPALLGSNDDAPPCGTVTVLQPAPDQLPFALSAETRRRFRCLSRMERRAVLLHYACGLSLAEVGERMGRSRGAVAGLVRRGRSKLRAVRP